MDGQARLSTRNEIWRRAAQRNCALAEFLCYLMIK